MEIKFFTGEHAFLSNFHPSKVTYDGEVYPTVEHAYQAAKTMDVAERRKIRMANKPSLAKSLGKKVKLRANWESVKLGVMAKLLREKFKDEQLAAQLVGTLDANLVEGNTWNDTFWGVCRGVGKNWLGKLLMQIREDLQPLGDSPELARGTHADN